MLEPKTVRALSLLHAQKKSLWADRLELATPAPRRQGTCRGRGEGVYDDARSNSGAQCHGRVT